MAARNSGREPVCPCRLRHLRRRQLRQHCLRTSLTLKDELLEKLLEHKVTTIQEATTSMLLIFIGNFILDVLNKVRY